jgi:DNA polymerase-3 subunit epsilon
VFQLGTLTRYSAVDPRGLEFAVLDTEASGLDPATGARLLEIAVVRMRGDGRVLDEYSTLVNPAPDLVYGGEIHGIEPVHLSQAPAFGDVVGDLLAIADGAIVASHHIDYRAKLLGAELARIGFPIPAMTGVCTLTTARAQLHHYRYSLPEVTLLLTGEWPAARASALGDARSCARVLAVLLNDAPHRLSWYGPPPTDVAELRLSRCRRTGFIAPRAARLRRGSAGWLACIATRLPIMAASPQPRPDGVRRYMALLEQALADGSINGDEADRLAVLASRAGFTQSTIREVHRQVVATARSRAELDGTVTATEFRELQRAARELDQAPMIADLETHAAADRARRSGPLKGWRVLPIGDDPDVYRAAEVAAGHGATIAVNVTRSLRMVISSAEVDDPRLAKAVNLGLPVFTAIAALHKIEQAIKSGGDGIFVRSDLAAQVYQELVEEQTRRAEAPEWYRAWRPEELDPRLCHGDAWFEYTDRRLE